MICRIVGAKIRISGVERGIGVVKKIKGVDNIMGVDNVIIEWYNGMW